MKNILFLLVAFILNISAASAQTPEMRFGAVGGLNMAMFSKKLPGVENENTVKAGIMAGFYATLRFHQHLGINSEILYTMHGNRITAEDPYGSYVTNYTLHYIALNAILHYYISDRFSLLGGPQVGIPVSATQTVDVETNGQSSSASTDITDELKALDLGAVMGLAYHFENGVSVQLRFLLGLSNIFDKISEDLKIKNQVLTLGITYEF